jgi:hypothetical protein
MPRIRLQNVDRAVKNPMIPDVRRSVSVVCFHGLVGDEALLDLVQREGCPEERAHGFLGLTDGEGWRDRCAVFRGEQGLGHGCKDLQRI